MNVQIRDLKTPSQRARERRDQEIIARYDAITKASSVPLAITIVCSQISEEMGISASTAYNVITEKYGRKAINDDDQGRDS